MKRLAILFALASLLIGSRTGRADEPPHRDFVRGLRARLMGTETGRFLVDDYNRRAPQIVRAVDASGEAGKVWAETYAEVSRIVALVRAERTAEAISRYRAMTETLWSRYVVA